jgi:uncharacterized protein (TIGR03437 family)
MVDGQVYSQAVTLNWVAGSKHLLVFLTDPPLLNQTTTTSIQTSVDGSTQYAFSGWRDNAGLLQPTTDPVQTITANPQITTITAGVQVSYRIMLNFFAPPDNPLLQPTCGAPGAIPAGVFRPGLVYLNGACYWATANVFVPANSQLALNAFPYPGFVFIGWALNSGAPNAYLTSLTVTSPMTIAPQFSPGKRVHFLTNPLGLNVLVDHTTSPTRTDANVNGPCPFNEQEPVYPGTGFPPVCFGDFDFAPGSTHVISGVSPQVDAAGNYWVFSKWSNGTGPNAVYTVDSNTAAPDTLTGTFVPGAHVGFLTSPTGLALNIDNRQNWPGYNFIWGLGETHTVTAAANQSDSKGRKYTFQSWSNSGSATQTVTVDQSAVSNGLLLTANYSVLSRILIQSYPMGMAVQVDGTSCQTPCNIDRPTGTKVQVTAQTQVGMGPSARLDFNNWSDGGPSDHTYTVTGDYAVLIASYTNSYQLSAISDPANGVSFQFSPSSSDMFYSEGTQVSVTATPNGGFKFRRWNGDLNGTYPSGTITMSTPKNVIAMMDTVPYIAPAGVRNAVGDTPSSTVAPGSLISISGQNLSAQTDVGRVNPLAQSIDGVTVTVNDRILPLLYVSPQQINAQVPSDLPDGDYTLQVHSAGQPDVSANFSIARNSPGLFGQSMNSQIYAVVLHADGSPVTPDSPAQAGETISLLGTGFGPYNTPVIDGFFPPDPPPALTDLVSISAGNQNPSPIWSGAAPGLTGITLTKFQIPAAMAGSGTVPLSVSINGANSNAVMLPIQ